MRPEVQSELTPFLKTVAASSEAALLLDYDGTLAPFRTQRDQAYPYPGVALVLQEIVRDCRTRVVVMSGRDASDVLPFLNIHPRPEVWGIHGLQRMKTDGSMEMPRLDDRTLDALSDADRWLGHQHLRHNAEFKAGSIAVHWRGMTEKDAEDLRARVTLGWRPVRMALWQVRHRVVDHRHVGHATFCLATARRLLRNARQIHADIGASLALRVLVPLPDGKRG